MGWASQRRPHRRPSYLSQASCVIVSGFTAALDLDTYPLRNFIRPRCAEWAKPGRGKPVLIMHIGFLACFHAIISRTRSFQQNRHISFLALVALKQERIIKRGGGRACNFRRFWTGQNNPPVLFIEHSFAREILIAWQDSVYARVRVYVPYSSYNGKFWMC